MMIGPMSFAVWFTAAGFVLSAAQLQESPQPQLTIKTDVRQVLVPAVVLDRSGHPVHGLKASDFEVLEDGRPQRIVAFEALKAGAVGPTLSPAANAIDPPPGAAGAPPVRAKAADDTMPKRTYLVLVDTLHTSAPNFGRVREALARFFQRERPSDAQYALITVGRETTIVQDSTPDPAKILAAIQSPEFPKLVRNSEAAETARAVEQFEKLVTAYCIVCHCGARQPPACADGIYKPQMQGMLNVEAERTFTVDRAFLHQLEAIVKATADMPTAGTILFISDGFNRYSGRELYAVLQGHDVRDGMFTFNPRDTQPELEATLKSATKSNVKFYTLDSRGLYSEASLPGSDFSATTSQMNPRGVESMIRSTARENTDALAELAHQTGGLFYENDNDLFKGIERAFADGREYYVLAYVPDNPALDGRYRKIEVTVKGKMRVNAKAGYWAAPN
jgi:VWFA-related protein